MPSNSKLKILHLTSHLNVGGITRYIQLLGAVMAGRGHKIAVASGGGALEAQFNKDGLKTYLFPIRKKSIIDPSLYFPLSKIAPLIQSEKYDIIHAHTRVTQALASFLGRKTKVPVVTTCHGYFKPNLGRKLFPAWGDRVVAISEPVAKDLQKTHRVLESKIRIVNNAIDLKDAVLRYSQKDPQAIRRQYKIPQGATVVCCIARLVQDKGQEILVRAVAGLLPSFPEIFLMIVGDGKEKEALEKVIQELDLTGRTVIVPSLEDISTALAVTDIFVHPAFYREGFGLGIAEAMAVGRPVVITDIPAVNTIFLPGECSVMAKPADVVSLAGAIRFLMEAPGEKARIAQAGRHLVSSLCDAERQADEMETIYRESINQLYTPGV